MFDAIVRGQIAPGARLREAQLAKEMGISRGVLREAMQRLEARKLVQRTPNIGVQVISLSDDDLEELYDVREALEGMAARLAATNMAEKDIKRLSNIIEKHASSEGVRKGESYFQGDDEDFHTLIAEGSGNKRLIQALGTRFIISSGSTASVPASGGVARMRHWKSIVPLSLQLLRVTQMERKQQCGAICQMHERTGRYPVLPRKVKLPTSAIWKLTGGSDHQRRRRVDGA